MGTTVCEGKHFEEEPVQVPFMTVQWLGISRISLFKHKMPLSYLTSSFFDRLCFSLASLAICSSKLPESSASGLKLFSLIPILSPLGWLMVFQVRKLLIVEKICLLQQCTGVMGKGIFKCLKTLMGFGTRHVCIWIPVFPCRSYYRPQAK